MKAFSATCCILLLSVLFTVSSCLAETLTIGVAPHISAPTVLEMYQPLRLHLQEALGCEVKVVTAPDFNEFARRGAAGAYDIAVTTSHQGRLLQTDGGFIPLLAYKGEFRSVVVVSVSSPVRKLRDLDAQMVAGVGPTSEVTLWGQHWLKINSAEVTFREVENSEKLVEAVTAGEAAAGFMSQLEYDKLPEPSHARLRILSRSQPMVSGVFLVVGEWSKKRTQLEAALWEFGARPEARKFFSDNNIEGFRRLKSYEMNDVDMYAAVLRRGMAQRGE